MPSSQIGPENITSLGTERFIAEISQNNGDIGFRYADLSEHNRCTSFKFKVCGIPELHGLVIQPSGYGEPLAPIRSSCERTWKDDLYRRQTHAPSEKALSILKVYHFLE